MWILSSTYMALSNSGKSLTYLYQKLAKANPVDTANLVVPWPCRVKLIPTTGLLGHFHNVQRNPSLFSMRREFSIFFCTAEDGQYSGTQKVCQKKVVSSPGNNFLS